MSLAPSVRQQTAWRQRSVGHERATATAARADGTRVTVIADDNWPVGHLVELKRRDIKSLARGIRHRKIKHLIEVAVVHPTLPADTDKIATHDLVQGCGVEVAF